MKNFILLSRDDFKNSVFARDNYKCVVCKNPAKDAHHIIERRLFIEPYELGGYFLKNGSSLCEIHHIEAETTSLSCDQIRELIGISDFPIPSHLYKDQKYDKWGNPILPNGMRLKGELFNDPSVQKILGSNLSLFIDYIKYPRTFHLPWSLGISDDDKVQNNLSNFIDNEVVVTVKMDGEATTLYSDYMHARSIEYKPHPSRDWIKSLHSRIANDIPKGWRICGENLYAKHSIKYENLESYFQVYSIWNDKNICLDWSQTIEWCELLDLKTVPILYIGIWNEKLIKGLYKETYKNDPCEGYVVRLANEFHYKDFSKCVSKFVRKDHVNTHGHWMRSKLELNKLKIT